MNVRALSRRGSQIACLLLLPFALWGCLDHVASGVTPGQPVVATVPDAFFQATPAACCQTPEATGPARQPGRYTLRGPGFFNWDASLFKNFSLAADGRWKLQLRAETFNGLNWVNPAGIASTNITATNFGQVNSFRAARRMQLAAKITF